MIIGTKPNSTLVVGDEVVLRVEQSGGRGKVTFIEDRPSEPSEPIFWCSFTNRSEGGFLRESLHCDRLDGKEITWPDLMEEDQWV